MTGISVFSLISFVIRAFINGRDYSNNVEISKNKNSILSRGGWRWQYSLLLVIAKETLLQLSTALGLKPDNSHYKLEINFCCFHAKYYIWLCKLKECPPKLPNFLLYLKHINEIENKVNITSQKKWEPLKINLSYNCLVNLVLVPPKKET